MCVFNASNCSVKIRIEFFQRIIIAVANLARTKQAKNYAIQRKVGDIYPAKVGGVDGNERKYTKNFIDYNQQNHIKGWLNSSSTNQTQ